MFFTYLFSGWVDVSWGQNVKASKTDNTHVKVVDISDPDVQAAMLEADERGKNENNKSLHQTTLDSALRQVVMSFGKRNRSSETDATKSTEGGNKTDKISRLNSESSTEDSNETAVDPQTGSRIDLANLQFLMAVEDLLDSSSSDLVASALAEAASMHVDQLRLATRSFRSTLLESKARPTPSAQGSRESQSPPTELNTPLVSEPNTPSNEATTASSDLGSVSEAPELSDVNKETGKSDLKTETDKEDMNSADTPETNPETFKLTKQECMNQIQKITSSMSEVLESMTANSGQSNVHNTGELDDDFEDTQNDDSLSVAENNFLNDNHNVLEPNVISLLNSGNAEDSSLSEDDDDDEQLDSDMVVREGRKAINYELLSAVTEEYIDPAEVIENIFSDNGSSDSPSGQVTTNSQESVAFVENSIAVKAREMSQEAVNAMLKLLSDNEDSQDIDRVAEQALQFLDEQNEGSGSVKMTDLLNTIIQSNNKDNSGSDSANKHSTDEMSLCEEEESRQKDRTDTKAIFSDIDNIDSQVEKTPLLTISENVDADVSIEFHSHVNEPASESFDKGIVAVGKNESALIDETKSDDNKELTVDDTVENNDLNKQSDVNTLLITDTSTEKTLKEQTALHVQTDVSDKAVCDQPLTDKVLAESVNMDKSLIDMAKALLEQPDTETTSGKSDESGMFSLEEILEVHKLSRGNQDDNGRRKDLEEVVKDQEIEEPVSQIKDTDGSKSTENDSKLFKDDIERYADKLHPSPPPCTFSLFSLLIKHLNKELI